MIALFGEMNWIAKGITLRIIQKAESIYWLKLLEKTSCINYDSKKTLITYLSYLISIKIISSKPFFAYQSSVDPPSAHIHKFPWSNLLRSSEFHTIPWFVVFVLMFEPFDRTHQ